MERKIKSSDGNLNEKQQLLSFKRQKRESMHASHLEETSRALCGFGQLM